MVERFGGVAIFSGSLPATRVAVMEFDAVFLTGARAVIAAVLAAGLLWARRQHRPARQDLLPLGVVALGTTLPGLASCVNAARQGEHDIALGMRRQRKSARLRIDAVGGVILADGGHRANPFLPAAIMQGRDTRLQPDL